MTAPSQGEESKVRSFYKELSKLTENHKPTNEKYGTWVRFRSHDIAHTSVPMGPAIRMAVLPSAPFLLSPGPNRGSLHAHVLEVFPCPPPCSPLEFETA